MINQQVIDYIRTEVAKATPKEVIIQNLKLGGGWSDEAISENFTAYESGIYGAANTAFSKNDQQKVRSKIFKLNIVIFLAYTLIAVLLRLVDQDITTAIVFFGYMWHAAILVFLSISYGIIQLVTKKPTQPGAYFLMAIVICLVGFGTCFGLLATGITYLSI